MQLKNIYLSVQDEIGNPKVELKKAINNYFSPVTDIYHAMINEIKNPNPDYSIKGTIKLFFLPIIVLFKNMKRRITI